MTSIERSESGAVCAEDFTAAFRHHPAGVAVITADAGLGPVALTATSVFSIGVEPPLLGFSISGGSSSTPTIRDSDTVVVHLLGAGQLSLARLGSTSGIDRFADDSIWKRLPTGEIHFPAASTWIRARVRDRMKAGNSWIVVVEALEVGGADSGNDTVDVRPEPLVYHDRTWHRLGAHSRIE